MRSRDNAPWKRNLQAGAASLRMSGFVFFGRERDMMDGCDTIGKGECLEVCERDAPSAT